jgi:hypothetical protein
LQGLNEIFLSSPVFSFLLASSPFFSTPYEAASHGNSSSKKMTKGISTKRVRGSTSRAAGDNTADWFLMDSPLLHVGLLTDKEKIPSDVFSQSRNRWRGGGAQGQEKR